MQIANRTAALPVSLFRCHHLDTLSNAGKSVQHANYLLQSDQNSMELKKAKAAVMKTLLEVKKSDKYCEEMATGQNMDTMDKYKVPGAVYHQADLP